MTDNTQELDEILERYRLHADMAYSEVEDNLRTAEEFKTLALPKVLADAKQAILDWHNKQIEAELEALREEVKHEDLRTISQVITARIDTLKTNKDNTVEEKL